LILYEAHKKIFELAEDIAFSLYKATNDAIWIETFFRLTEENRAILLRNQLRNFSALDYAGVPDSILEQERKLAAQLRNEDDDLQAMKNIVDLERQYLALVQYIQETYPEYYALKYFDQTFSINEVQNQLLTADNSLLIYSLTNDYLYALLIDQQVAKLFRLPNADEKANISNLNHAVGK